MEASTWLYAVFSCSVWFHCYRQQFCYKLQNIIFYNRREHSPQTLFFAMMGLEAGVLELSQTVETWTSCYSEVGCKATKLAVKMSFLIAPNSTVKLGYCSFLRVKKLLKANTMCGSVEKETSEEKFLFFPRISKWKLQCEMVHGISAYLHKYMHIYVMHFPEVYLRQSECWNLILPFA